MTNVLFLGGGRRVGLAERFAWRGCKVFGYELDPKVPLASVGKIIAGERWDACGFETHLRDVVEKHAIGMVLPLDCRAVEAVSRICGLPIVVSDRETAEICLNKKRFEAHCVGKPDTNYPFPQSGHTYVTKPYHGFGSRGVSVNATGVYDSKVCEDAEYQMLVVQKKLYGREYSIDAYFDRNGLFVNMVARERLRVAGGEVLDSAVVDAEPFRKSIFAIGEGLLFRGPTCFQFMENEPYSIQRRYSPIEVNARLGGGSTLSMQAGLDMIEMMLREYADGADLTFEQRKPLVPKTFRMARSYKDHYFNEAPSV